MTTAPALAAPVWCYRCGTAGAGQLFARLGEPWGFLCAQCWHSVGCPWPAVRPTAQDAHDAELRTRERMLARGGTARHLVRNGRT